MRVLITCGPTWVPIDDVRVISNVSTGEMGHLIAEAFMGSGDHVTVIQGPVTHHWEAKNAKVLSYKYFDELKNLLEEELRNNKYDIVVHNAAVSDFKVEDRVKGKIDSQESFSLFLVPTEKLIDRIKKINPNLVLVGFKFGTTFNQAKLTHEAQRLFEIGCDWVVANTIEDGYRALIMDQLGTRSTNRNKESLAQDLVRTLKDSNQI